ncbi:tRNA (adenosine(37)-N6)-threonylcarbamoyltransferase complex dimerization subunit type 1 TsaB [Enterobacteriaceae endosymbiont of Macroplea mutica]|uniref:tRNA (adenosine(37)-N6)-threonylcarbamoyltransferase complex dimerization subunit type 1 TsaB n=1 Tax=Enterobacteriaceae endosymbiont of Macroplea mutica TaxID=2675791 RepID=UPI00144980AC|nr:tRNA (adenosine(37)-N6)-threonylcarbamoyltransferase complex dimerization subunit type 1 TsaB [Enterobacteriaceae endosymbiont of Macroplea mutica]QJC31157.1 tRNA (adenosine(37)-N6)-threonylcarbamoyltransferase complex dimerization subunit type 1 TsaB [Enterobacteriaceae endosymbiont of Macroplea mutica]
MYQNILTINTCHKHCIVTLQKGHVITAVHKYSPNTHTQYIFILIQKLLQQHNLFLKNIDILGYALGPGNFTSIRVGAAVAEGISFALNIPKIGVSSLMIRAEQAWQCTNIKNIISIIKYNYCYVYFAIYKRTKKGLWLGKNSECILHYNNVIKNIMCLQGLWVLISDIYGFSKYNITSKINNNLTVNFIYKKPSTIKNIVYIINNMLINNKRIYKKYPINYIKNIM